MYVCVYVYVYVIYNMYMYYKCNYIFVYNIVQQQLLIQETHLKSNKVMPEH